MRVSDAIVGGAAALALMCGPSVRPAAAQTAPPAISAQDERLLSLLPPGLQGSGSEVLLAPNAVARDTALRTLVEQAEAPPLLLPVAAFVAGLGDANRCPENAKDWDRPRSFPCVSHLSSLLSQHGINVVEMVSCYTDVIFIVEDKDTVPAYEILRKHVG